MTTEQDSVLRVLHFAAPTAAPTPVGYFRSKLFISHSTSNPLVAAASPLFSLLERLCVSPTLPPIDGIRDNIEHELQAFNCRLLGLNYANEFIVIAHYLLSATMDELLGKNYLRLHGQPIAFKALTPPSLDEEGPQQRFFEILQYIKGRTNQYLDLLEIAYYCLIAGFEGEQHLRADGRQTLDNLIEELYHLIQQHRVYKPQCLFKETQATITVARNYKPIITACLLAFSTIIVLYITSHALLEHRAKTLLLGHMQIISRDVLHG